MMEERARVLIGLIGSRLGASSIASLQEAAGDAYGLRYVCWPLDIGQCGMSADSIGDLLSAARTWRFAGLNILAPCQQSVVRHLDELSPAAAVLGDVDTVVFRDARTTVGHHTAPDAFEGVFARRLPGASLDRVVMWGGSGAASAVAYALLRMGVRYLVLVDPVVERAELVADVIERAEHALTADVRIETTHDPHAVVDLAGHIDGVVVIAPPSAAEMSLLARSSRPGRWVADLSGRPRAPLPAGAMADVGWLDADEILLAQAAEGFRLFTGISPEPARMRHRIATGDSEPAMKSRLVNPSR
jgi:shikimate dehydrogenase